MDKDIIVYILIAVIILYFLYVKIKIPPTDYSKPERVLTEVDVLLAYGRNKQAIALLEKAIIKNKDNHIFREKINELNKEISNKQ